MATGAPVSSASNHVYLVIGVLPPLWSGRCSREQRAGEQDAVPHDCPPSGTAFARRGSEDTRLLGTAHHRTLATLCCRGSVWLPGRGPARPEPGGRAASGIQLAGQQRGLGPAIFPNQRTWVDLKKRKKFEPASMARPAASAASIILTEVIPLLPSAAGQSLWSMTSIGLTSHQIGLVLRRSLSTT